MKVISEYTIKKLIQAKLLENYKKKLLTEEDNSINETDFKNQIISTGIIEALYLFLTEPEFTNALQDISPLIKSNIPNQLNIILQSNDKADFVQKTTGLLQTLSTFLNAQPSILNTTLFTHLIAYDNIILEKFNEKMEDIKSNKAFVTQGDLYVIENHLTKGTTYKGFWPFKGIKDTIKEMISELLTKPAQTLTAADVMNKIANLLPVLNLPQNQQNNTNGETPSTNSTTTSQVKKTTSQQIMNVGFAELKDSLNLSPRQLKKLGRQIKQIAEKRTNSEDNSKKYQALLVALTLKQATGTQNLTGTTENTQTAVDDSKTVLIKLLQTTQQKFKDCYFHFKREELTDGFETEENKETLYNWLTYVISDSEALNSDNETIFSFQPKDMVDEFITHLTLQTEQILINNSEQLILQPGIKTAAKNFFKEINETANDNVNSNNKLSNEFKLFKKWIQSYFQNAWIEDKKLMLDYDFINYIQLKFLESKDIDVAKEALKNFNVNGKNKIKTTSGEVITSENAKAITKEYLEENKDKHTDNFKLPAQGVLTKKHYQQMANYLLNPKTTTDFGFINKSNEEKTAYAQKLKDANLNADKIAEALKKLYPKAGDFKTKGNKERWIANYFLNINADEIIAAADGVATSDTDTEETETTTATTKDCLSKDNGNRYNFRLLSREDMAKLIKPNPTPDDYREVMAELLLGLKAVPAGYGFKLIDRIKFRQAIEEANQELVNAGKPELTVDQIKKALAEIYPKSDFRGKSTEKWYPEYYININPHEIISVAKTH
jgi:hypothetical protein